MKITQNLNVAGYSFVVEQDAASSLEEYMDALASACSSELDKKEILEDIEARIAELLTEVRGGSEVITGDMVSYVKMRIGDASLLKGDEPEEGAPESAAPEPQDHRDCVDSGEKPRTGRRLYRDMEGKNIGGVCSGLAYYFNTDVTLIRVIWTALLIGGLFFWDGRISWIAIFVYLVACLCIPTARTVAQRSEMTGIPVDLTRYAACPVEPVTRTSRGHQKSTLLRILCICSGLVLLCAGIGCVAGSAVMPVIPSFQHGNFYASISSDIVDGLPDGLDINALLSPAFWWILFAFTLTMGLGLCYAALMLIFDFNAPKWHPGLILLLLWVISIIAMVVYGVMWAAGASDTTLVQLVDRAVSLSGAVLA